MILRDPLLSEERVALRVPRAQRVAALRLAGENRIGSRARDENAASTMKAYAEIAGQTVSAAAVPISPSPEPTLETVLQWLARQEEAPRRRCAQDLAPELAALHAAARAQGFAAGEQAGRQDAETRTAVALQSLQQMTAAAGESVAAETAQLAELCADIVAQALLKIAGPLLSTREAALGAVAEVLQKIKEDRELTIRVHPADVGVLQAREAALAAALGGRRFSVQGDVRVGAGGCIVEAKLGSLDGRIETQLRECCETLRAAKNAAAESI